jgi:glycyl-tRNA synthetase
MAEAKTGELMEKIVSLCKRRGFIFQSSEIYGGINGFWDYGPLGAELKRNIKEYWWRSMTQWRDDVVGLEASIIMHPKIWEASGHTSTFSDLMVDCLLTKKRFRADQIEPQSGTVFKYAGAESKEGGWSVDKPFAVLVRKGEHPDRARKVARQFYTLDLADDARGALDAVILKEDGQEQVENSTRFNPENGSAVTEPRPFNLMLKTYVGPVQTEDNVAYLRPETAQAIFVQFKNALESSRQKVPFGVAQIGKAFRNEINPRNYTFRSREFEQMELEYFIRPDEVVQKMAGTVAKLSDAQPSALEPCPSWGWELWHKYWVEQRIKWYESIGLSRDTLVEYWQPKEELAHYAKATVDIQFKFPFGTQELEGIAARGDFDLTQHQKFSGKSMEYFDEEAKAKYVPHVIEPSAGVDRLALALICNAYCEDQAPDEKGKMETRVVMRFHPRIAPIKVAVFPLLKNKPDLVRKAKEVRDLLRPLMTVFYDEAGAIGRRYRRQDEAGTPFGVTIDFDTLGEHGVNLKDTVTLRDRDTMKQERVNIGELAAILSGKIR